MRICLRERQVRYVVQILFYRPTHSAARRTLFPCEEVISIPQISFLEREPRLSRRKSVLSAHFFADGKGEVSLTERRTSLNYAFSHINYFSPPNSSHSATSPQSNEICCSPSEDEPSDLIPHCDEKRRGIDSSVQIKNPAVSKQDFSYAWSAFDKAYRLKTRHL